MTKKTTKKTTTKKATAKKASSTTAPKKAPAKRTPRMSASATRANDGPNPILVGRRDPMPLNAKATPTREREDASRLTDRSAVILFGPAVLGPSSPDDPRPISEARDKALALRLKAATSARVDKGRAASPRDAAAGAGATRANVGRTQAKAESRRPSGLDLAAKVLAEAGEPLAAKAIAERAVAAGWTTSGKTPHATLYAAIIREIAAKGEDARFRKTDRGLFATTGKEA